MSDKRSTHTDALATLGTIITDGGRDAIHLAVEPIVAGEKLFPGGRIGILNNKAYIATGEIKALGIVDPFLNDPVCEGSKFWLIVFPRQITSLRHVWSHPGFPEEESNKSYSVPSFVEDEVDRSQKWISEFAEKLGFSYTRLMDYADTWASTSDSEYGGEYTYDNSESYKEFWDEFKDFWTHYEVIRGKLSEGVQKECFFTCSC